LNSFRFAANKGWKGEQRREKFLRRWRLTFFAKRFEEINKEMVQECGGKAAHLGELTHLQLNVPKGFCVIGAAFNYHLRKNDLEEQIDAAAKRIHFEDLQDLEAKTEEIRSLIEKATMPGEIEKEIIENYRCLSQEEAEPFVAIRSSVAIKDSEISSFPGMMDTFHYIRGNKAVIENVKKCWASVWSARGSFARYNKGIEHSKAIIAPTIQLMVDSEISGVLFTVNPVSGEKEEIVIESNWGLGESVVCGKCLCDFYTADKKQFDIKVKRIARKEQTYRKAGGGGAEWVNVEPDKVQKPTLTDAQVEELCRIACRIEGHYGYPQDIEWAFEGGIPYILQARKARVAGE
jgi:pyruvate,water dikinase